MANLDEERIRRIDELVRRIEQIPDRETRDTAHQLMESILELHGAGLDRAMEIVADSGDSGQVIIRHFANDALVSSLLLLHGLHPDDIETRVRRALSKLAVNAELVAVFDGAVRVRVQDGRVQQAVEEAVWVAAPDAAEVLVEEAAQLNSFVPLAALGFDNTRMG